MERAEQLRRLKRKQIKDEGFDILVVGGGATGAGIALDATSRGLKAALVERDDFASGTSSRSTKLIHGGVRYLQRAVLHFDRGQFSLVREALQERATLLEIAPHLARLIPLLTPLYQKRDVPYYTTGLKLYDWLAGKASPRPSHYVSSSEALKHCPMLNAEGLKGGVVYYDGQFDDARMNVSIAMKAAELGAAVANHVEVTGLTKTGGRVDGANLRDRLNGDTWSIRARVVINATGPFSDALRLMDDAKAPPLLSASSGVHIVLGRQFSSNEMGLLIPKTEDGRVLFLLPWLGHTLVGTTDNPAPVEANPKPSDEDIDYILRQLKKYFSLAVNRSDILSSWSGLRPLVAESQAKSTAKISREHVLLTSESGLLTIAGGKWTTYRRMAMEAVDEAIEIGSLKPESPSRTESIPLAGADKFVVGGDKALATQFDLEPDVAKYLHRAYGDRAPIVAELGRVQNGGGKPMRLLPSHPYLEAEVLYATQRESACTSLDVLARRMRLCFLDKAGAREALPKTQEILAKAFDWNESRVKEDAAAVEKYLE